MAEQWRQYAEGDSCPKCGMNALEREMVDVGVCVVPGPWRCLDCAWHEELPTFDLQEDSL